MLHKICFGYYILYMVMAGKIKNPFVYTLTKTNGIALMNAKIA